MATLLQVVDMRRVSFGSDYEVDVGRASHAADECD